MTISIYVDGACKPNPGKGGIGVIFEGEIRYTISEPCGKRVTNNQAEYRAVSRALNDLLTYHFNTKEIFLCSDSEMLVEQLNNRRMVEKGKYLNDYLEVKRLMKSFPNLKISWIPREMNDEANLLASKAVKSVK